MTAARVAALAHLQVRDVLCGCTSLLDALTDPLAAAGVYGAVQHLVTACEGDEAWRRLEAQEQARPGAAALLAGPRTRVSTAMENWQLHRHCLLAP
jgi:hypothetical protein